MYFYCLQIIFEGCTRTEIEISTRRPIWNLSRRLSETLSNRVASLTVEEGFLSTVDGDSDTLDLDDKGRMFAHAVDLRFSRLGKFVEGDLARIGTLKKE